MRGSDRLGLALMAALARCAAALGIDADGRLYLDALAMIVDGAPALSSPAGCCPPAAARD